MWNTKITEELDFEKFLNNFQKTRERFNSFNLNFNFQEYNMNFHETNSNLQVIDERFREIKEMLWKSVGNFNLPNLELENELLETAFFYNDIDFQTGNLGDYFGAFIEDLLKNSNQEEIFIPSIQNILEKQFNCTTTSEKFSFSKKSVHFDIDVLGYSADSCYIVDIHRKLTEKHIEQLNNKIELFDKNMQIFSDLTKYGVIVAAEFNQELYNIAIKHGLYFISMAGDNVKLITSKI